MTETLDRTGAPASTGAAGVHQEQLPTTGLPSVDQAIAQLADLDERPVGEHPDALAAAHEALHTELQSSPAGSQH